MVRQQVDLPTMVLNAHKFLVLQDCEMMRDQLDYEARQRERLKSYALLRALGVPYNGLRMLFGEMAQQLEPVLAFPPRQQIKCALCGDDADALVQTKGLTLMAVCDDCKAHLVSVGCQVIL
jgi:hypothetical protein